MTSRHGYLLGLAICVGLLAFAAYLQYVENEVPCPLCLVQRAVYGTLALVFLAGAVHAPKGAGTLGYSGIAVLLAGLGATVAGRQVWLQHLPKDRVPACGPGLEYMLRKFPLSDVLTKVFSGSGECAEAGWRFLGLTVAGWSLVWFVLLVILAAAVAIAALRRSRGMGK